MDASLTKSAKDLTDCWSDDERMDFLFSDFPSEAAVNPEHWRNKMDFWTKLITDLCCSSTLVCVNFEVISSWVERDGRSPLGLKVVWEKMIADKSLVVASEFIGDIARNASWVGWGVNMFVRKPTMWMAGKVLSPLKTLSPIKTFNNKKVSHVCMKAFLQKCKSLFDELQAMHSHIHGNLHIISFPILLGLSKSIVSSEKDLEFLLLSLEKEKKVEIFEKESSKSGHCVREKFVKFAKSPQTTVTPVSEYDLGVLKLEDARKALEKQISELYKEQARLVEMARGCLRGGERASAKNALRQKQRSVASVKKKQAALDNVNQLLERIEQCKSDQMIMEAYKAGVATYNNTVKENGLDIDSVDATMDDLNAMLTDHDDIASTLASPVGDNSVSNEELEKELSDILGDENDDNNGVVSSQTDADIAKLVSGISVASIRSPSSKSSPKKKVRPLLSS